ncbi:hypothetical protein BGZ63DRAFT_423953 [Mariannaea sp. PMI_226]|nr:hypothetical protein BGZ63DRAFT_423953 [Mariannaea sp. PMI_226]
MGFPCQVFHASELPDRVQSDLKGRKRKLQAGERNVDLSGCELLEMLQYKCEIKEPVKWDSPVQCYAVDRLFRKCMDRKGSFMVETTAWEGKDFSSANHQKGSNGKNDGSQHKSPQHYQWSSTWSSPDSAR